MTGIEAGKYYSSGTFGHSWSVRYVIDIARDPGGDPGLDRVSYKIVVGPSRRSSAVATRAEFSKWARYEVAKTENEWVRVD